MCFRCYVSYCWNKDEAHWHNRTLAVVAKGHAPSRHKSALFCLCKTALNTQASSRTDPSYSLLICALSLQNGQLPCNSDASPGSVGGYQPVTDQDELSSIQKNLAPLAFQKYTFTHNVTGCSAKTVVPGSYSITRACKQVCLPANSAQPTQVPGKLPRSANTAEGCAMEKA